MEILTIDELLEQNVRADIARMGGKGVIYSNVDNEDYHKGPGLSSTNLKTILTKSIRDYFYEKENFKETAALLFGSQFHCFCLEPDFFYDRYYTENAIPTIPKRNTKEGKTLFTEWSLENEKLLFEKYNSKLDSDQWKQEYTSWVCPELKNKRLVTYDNVAALEQMKTAIYSNPFTNAALDGTAELSIYWIDLQTDLLLKCRPDCLNTKLSCITDLKSCQSATREDFQRDITKYLYHLSAAFYIEGVKQALGEEFDFIYAACEKDKTFKSAPYRADTASIEAGQELFRISLDRFAKWKDDPLKNNDSLPIEITDIGVMPYAFNHAFAFRYDDE